MNNSSLHSYLFAEILPLYRDCYDEGHRADHILEVLSNVEKIVDHCNLIPLLKKELSEIMNIPIEECSSNLVRDILTAGAIYHDIALLPGSARDIKDSEIRKHHHEIGSHIVLNDSKLYAYFTPEVINLIADMVKGHRSSNSSEPVNNTFIKIVADADTLSGLDLGTLIFRYLVARVNEKEYEYDSTEMRHEVITSIHKKYGYSGYSNFHLKLSDDACGNKMKILKEVLEDKKELRNAYDITLKSYSANTFSYVKLGAYLTHANIVTKLTKGRDREIYTVTTGAGLSMMGGKQDE